MVWADTYYGAVSLEESVYSLALLKAEHVRRKPEVRHSGVPRAGDVSEGGEKKKVRGA